MTYYTVLFLQCDAMLAWYYAVVGCASVCQSVHLSHQICVETATRRIMQRMPHDSLGLQFTDGKDFVKIRTER